MLQNAKGGVTEEIFLAPHMMAILSPMLNGSTIGVLLGRRKGTRIKLEGK